MKEKTSITRLNPIVSLPDWVWYRVDEICDLGRGRVISQDEIHRHAGDYPVFSSQSKDDGILGYIDTYDFDGDYVTWTTDGANAGTVFLRTERFNCTNVCGTLKPKYPDTSANFLARFLSTLTKRHVSYVGNPKLMNNVMAAIRVRMPIRAEQDGITVVLDTVDEAIARTEAVIVKLKQVRAGLLHDLLTRGLDEHGQLRDPIAHPEHFKKSHLGWVPREWDIVHLGSQSSLVTSGSRGWAPYYSQDGPLFLRVGNLTREHINLRFKDIVRVRPPAGTEGRRTRVNSGDILISITADLGIIGVVPEDFEEAYVNQHIALVRPVHAVVPRWLGRYLAFGSAAKQFMALNDTGAKAGLNLRTIQSLLVAVPNREEQLAASICLDAIDKQVSEQVQFTDKLGQLKSGLMTDLLTGRVRVPEDLLPANREVRP
jgi:type I restriction enzyme, S subunit